MAKSRTSSVSCRDRRHVMNMSEESESEDVEIGEATWGEVFHGCCVHSFRGWVKIAVGLMMILACLYFFGIGLEFLGSGAKVMSGCVIGDLFPDSINPIAAVMTGVLATVLLQSSSTTTSIIVGLVGTFDSTVTVRQGIYVIMGANIGTTVTNTIISLAHFQDSEQLGRAFSGATIHDTFNILTVAILLPVEVVTGYLYRFTKYLIRASSVEDGETWEGPAKRYIKPLAEKVIIANKAVTKAVVAGDSCDDFYPIVCENSENPTKASCSQVGLIACSKKTGYCPLFFQADATKSDDIASGVMVFILGLFVVFLSLHALVKVLEYLLRGVLLRVVYRVTDINGYFLILIGCGLTMILQSSSTTTSFLTPLVGMGALRLKQMYPLTIGANLGTTLSALLASLVTDGNEGLQVALAHLMFNITGMLIWYPIPVLREIPMRLAMQWGEYARVLRSFTLVYLLLVFYIVPGLILGLSAMFANGATGLQVLGSVLVALLLVLVLFGIRWCCFQQGRIKFYQYLVDSHDRYHALKNLTSDIDKVRQSILRHQEYAGLHGMLPEATEEIERQETESSPAEVAQALQTVAHDMHCIKGALEILTYHCGLPDEGSVKSLAASDVEASGIPGDSKPPNQALVEVDGKGSERAPINATGNFRQHLTGLRNIRRRRMVPEHPITLLEEIPKHFWLLAVGLTVVFVVSTAVLFKNPSAATTAAGILLVLVGSGCVVYILYHVRSDTARFATATYFRNGRKRQEYIKKLPNDVKLFKSQINELFRHYHLKLKKSSPRQGRQKKVAADEDDPSTSISGSGETFVVAVTGKESQTES